MDQKERMGFKVYRLGTMKRLDKINRVRYGSPETYTWNNGNIAFGNPLDIPAANERKRQKAKEDWREQKALNNRL